MPEEIKEAIILCGGLGTRFRSVSESIPKTLAPVSGQPVLRWLIDDLTNMGIKKIILATGHLSKNIEKFVESNNLKNCFISREEKPLGTGGAIKNAQNHIKKNIFIVLNGDSRINFDLIKFLNFHTKNSADMSLLLSSVTKGIDYGFVNLAYNNLITSFNTKNLTEKTKFINSGVYCMNKSLLFSINENTNYSLEKELLPCWIKEKKIFGYVVNIPFIDIGTKKRYIEAKFE